MGQAAVKLDEAPEAEIVPLKPPAPKPTLTVVPPSPELAGIMSLITRAANLLAAESERADLLDKRSVDAEKQLQVANRRLADAEIKLGSAVDQAKTEKLRAAEMQRRSGEVLEKTRAMLAQASDRLRAAEARADKAESALAMVQQAMERQFTPLLS